MLKTLLVLLFFCFCAHSESIPGEYLVSFAPTADHKAFSLLEASSLVVGQPSARLFKVKRTLAENPVHAVEVLENIPGVRFAEPNYIYKIDERPNDFRYKTQWGLRNTGRNDPKGRYGEPGFDANVEKAWSLTTGSKKIIVAVIDTGLDPTHPDLQPNMWTNLSERNGLDGVDDDQNGYVDDIHGFNFDTLTNNITDDHSHGTHVAGTVGARGNNRRGVTGVNWQVSLMPLKVTTPTGSTDAEKTVMAIDYAIRNGARVINYSIGGSKHSQAVEDAIVRARDAGVLFVTSAGNKKADNDRVDHYPSNLEIENIVAVAASNNSGHLASFSNYGLRTVHIAAPGRNILSTSFRRGGYSVKSGTSMASPHVAGAAALILSHNPQLSVFELRDRLLRRSSPLETLDGKVSSGGHLDIYAALTDRPSNDRTQPPTWKTIDIDPVESPHPYRRNSSQEYFIRQPGANRMQIFFERIGLERGKDTVKIFDVAGKEREVFSSNRRSYWSKEVNGDQATIQLISDSARQRYGFKATRIKYLSAEP